LLLDQELPDRGRDRRPARAEPRVRLLRPDLHPAARRPAVVAGPVPPRGRPRRGPRRPPPRPPEASAAATGPPPPGPVQGRRGGRERGSGGDGGGPGMVQDDSPLAAILMSAGPDRPLAPITRSRTMPWPAGSRTNRSVNVDLTARLPCPARCPWLLSKT